MDTSSSIPDVFDPNDLDYFPDDSSATTTPASSQASSQEERAWQDPKVIVYESCLKELLKICQHCGRPINDTSVTYIGAMMKVKWDCLGECDGGTWTSSPELRDGMPQVNLLSAASVLFTGGTITDLLDWTTLMNVKMIRPTTFYDMQKSYLGPAIQDECQLERDTILARLCLEEEEDREEGNPPTPVHLSGDGRCVHEEWVHGVCPTAQ